MDAPPKIIELVDRFGEHEDNYRAASYSETPVRRDFIDPFFRELGWDVDNQKQYAESYREVVHEPSLKIGDSTKSPDYSFRVGGVRKFFVEAKKPSVNIKQDTSPAYQLRRYAWSAKLPLSILTDFEELAVYDCRIRPERGDKASTARTLYFTYDQYVDRWGEIALIFSRDAILKGSFDKYAESTKRKRGTAEVDGAFLTDIEEWRTKLASNLALRNEVCSQREVNTAVQKTIDRIIFLRICEDRGIERYGELQSLLNGSKIYSRLCELFRHADDRYNSGLFYFTKEKNRTAAPDQWTLSLKIDDEVLKKIIGQLYYPESPYEFSVLGADILGQVYEQFLGKVIRLTPSRRVKIEEKPEVKKAGGVYYTPTYIVDYIVQQTVGKLVEGKQPHEVAGRTKSTWKPSKRSDPITVLDPACGSGSFLLGAYQYLLDWYRDFYVNNKPMQFKDRVFQSRHDEWRLTTAERKRILLDHVHGVDIDPQAVEVTKLSLLLKVLEGESQETIQQQSRLFHERALPDLANNIKCGNSLIGPDFYEGQQTLFDEEEALRINVFDWQAEFVEIMGRGGFDAVIGNPPYVDVKILGDDVKAALTERFRSATRRFDLYIPFVEQGLQLATEGGVMAYIIPSMFAKRDYGQDLRTVISASGSVSNVVDFGSNQVFSGPMNYVGIFVVERSPKNGSAEITRIDRWDLTQQEMRRALTDDCSSLRGVKRFRMEQNAFSADSEWYFRTDDEKSLIERMFLHNCTLEELLDFASEGIHSGKDSVFFVRKDVALALGLETPPTQPLAKGKDVHRYDAMDVDALPNVVVYPYNCENGKTLDDVTLRTSAPNTWKYLNECRSDLGGRTYFEKSNKKWYELWCPRTPLLYTQPKIVGPEIAARGEFTLCKEPLFFNNKLKGLIPKSCVEENVEYLLGILNSALLVYLHRAIAPPKGGGFFEVKTRIVGRLPIRKIDFSNEDDRQGHDRMVELVEQILSLNERVAKAKTDHQKTVIQRQITATDNEIDQLVYELYGLTDEEIRIVDEAVSR